MAGGPPGGEHGHQEHGRGGGGELRCACGANAVKHSTYETHGNRRASGSHNDPYERHHTCLAQDRAHDAAAVGTERHANADIASSARNQLRQDAVKAHHRKHRGKQCKPGEQHGPETRL